MRRGVMGVKVYGSSDDLIEVEGDLDEEFNVYLEGDESFFLGFSDGTLVQVWYDRAGIWRTLILVIGRSATSLHTPVGEEYSEVLELTGEKISWVVCGKDFGVDERQNTQRV